MLFRAVAGRVCRFGVRAEYGARGWIDAGMTDSGDRWQMSEEALKASLARIPWAAWPARDIARPSVFPDEPRANYISGTAPDGGWRMSL